MFLKRSANNARLRRGVLGSLRECGRNVYKVYWVSGSCSFFRLWRLRRQSFFTGLRADHSQRVDL